MSTPGELSIRNRYAVAAGVAILAGLTLAFFLLWWNRFSAVRDGNGSIVAATAILEGKLPYRDWYSAAPPLHFLKTLAVIQLFGHHLIVPRAFALVERICLALVIYFWLRRFARPSHAAMAAFLGIVVSAGDTADPLVSYNHDTILMGVISGYWASIFIDRAGRRWSWVAAALSGLFAGLCLSTKQSIGIGITLGVPVVVAAYLCRSAGFQKALRFLALFAAGWAVPICAICAWLLHENALREAVRSIFFSGPSGKGFDSLFLRVVAANYSPVTLVALAAAAWCLRELARKMPARPAVKDSGGLLRFALIAAAVLLGAVLATRAQLIGITGFPRFTITCTLLTTGLLASFYATVWIRRRITESEAQIWLLSTVSFVVAFMLFLSWPSFEAMVIPGLSFLMALLLERSEGWYRRVLWGLCAALLFTQTVDKLERPYLFSMWRDAPVRLANVRSSLPELEGFRFPGETVHFIESVTELISRHTSPGDTIFTYPAMPIFYHLSGRWWPTYSGNHNMDVIPDWLAKTEAETIIRKRPAVIVYGDMPALYRDYMEMIWRGERPAGQRDIVAAIETMAQEYQLAGTFQISTVPFPIKVYLRPGNGVR